MFVLVVVSNKIVPPNDGPNKGKQFVIVSCVDTVPENYAASVIDQSWSFSLT